MEKRENKNGEENRRFGDKMRRKAKVRRRREEIGGEWKREWESWRGMIG